MQLEDIAKQLNCEIIGAKAGIEISGVCPIEASLEGHITFLTKLEYAEHLKDSKAAAVICGKPLEDVKIAQLIHKNPYYAFAKTAQLFYKPTYGPAGIHPTAIIGEGAQIADTVKIGANVVIGEGVKIAAHSVLFPGVYVGAHSTIGENTVIKANVVIEDHIKIGSRVLIHGGAVLGADGFGFAPGEDEIAKIPQIGHVIIEDDVEIGANSTIDCGALRDTVIGAGSKLDSHVHIAHNANIGKNVMLCGMSAIAGSAKVGNNVIVGGNSCVRDHVTVGDGVQLGGHSAITKNTPEAGQYLGFPAQPIRSFNKMMAYMRRLEKIDAALKKIGKS